MKKRNLLGSVLVFLILITDVKASHLRNNLLIAAKLDGAQESPAVVTNAMGVAGFVLNGSRDTLCINITFTGLSGPITGIHIHEGDPGVNGGVIKDLGAFVAGNRISAILTGTDVSVANISKLLKGKYYINIHTSANPNGEIRGQLYLETDISFPVSMDGAQEVPPVVNNAYGVGVFNLSKDLSKIRFNVVTQGLSGSITGAHLHYGAAGAAGPVAVDFTTNVNGNIISGTISAPSQDLIDSMMLSKVYLNVHTAANPGGEIRGQLLNHKRFLFFDAAIDGAQEVPSVSTNARGSASIKLNSTYDTLWYDIAVTGLSGTISSAHFHNGAAGFNGAVEYDLASGINGNRISGKVMGGNLTTALINKFLRGECYINIHTDANPSGEIRGQVYRLAREGYRASLDGLQESPPVVTSASGSGIVSIDRDHSNAHFMIVANGLTPTGAHFHKGIAGQNGGVLYDLTPVWMNNAAYGYWRNSDATPFLPMNAVQFRSDSIYINVHTVANPNGEIRGQVLSGFQCTNLTTGLYAVRSFAESEMIVYPNPSSDYLNIELKGIFHQYVQISIVDVLGKEVLLQRILRETEAPFAVDISALKSGFYLLRVEAGQQHITGKIIKQ
jgi:hypothetical protein